MNELIPLFLLGACKFALVIALISNSIQRNDFHGLCWIAWGVASVAVSFLVLV